MKKALVYLRVSDPTQEVRDSLNKQEEQVLKYCDYKGYKIHKIIKEVGSGRRNDREGFQELEDEISHNTFDVLVFYELSRLARNSYLLHNLIQSMRVNKIEFESVQEPFLNSDSPTSKAMLGFMAGFAEMESDKTRERVRSRMKHYTEQGYFVFRPSHGYDLVDNILVKNNYSAEVVDIYKKFIAGASYESLRREYGFSAHKIKRLLQNRIYLGEVKFGFSGRDKDTGMRFTDGDGEYYKGLHESIIDIDTFNTVQNIIRGNREKRYKPPKGSYLLSGLLEHHCGGRVYAKRKKDVIRGKEYIYFYSQCHNCGKFVGRIDKLEEAVVTEVKNYCLTLQGLDTPSKKKKEIDINKELSKLKTKRKRIIDIYLDEIISREEYFDRLKNVDDMISNLKNHEKVEEPVEAITSYKILQQHINNFDKKATLEKNTFLKMIIEKVVVYNKDEIEIIFKV